MCSLELHHRGDFRAAAQLQFLPPASYQTPNGSASHWVSSFLKPRSHRKEKAPEEAVSGFTSQHVTRSLTPCGGRGSGLHTPLLPILLHRPVCTQMNFLPALMQPFVSLPALWLALHVQHCKSYLLSAHVWEYQTRTSPVSQRLRPTQSGVPVPGALVHAARGHIWLQLLANLPPEEQALGEESFPGAREKQTPVCAEWDVKKALFGLRNWIEPFCIVFPLCSLCSDFY